MTDEELNTIEKEWLNSEKETRRDNAARKPLLRLLTEVRVLRMRLADAQREHTEDIILCNRAITSLRAEIRELRAKDSNASAS